MNARRVWTLVLALAMLATSARAASSASIASAPPTAATLPPQLQALEQKMEQLQVNSERFSVLLQGVGKVTSESSGGKGGKAHSPHQARLAEREAAGRGQPLARRGRDLQGLKQQAEPDRDRLDALPLPGPRHTQAQAAAVGAAAQPRRIARGPCLPVPRWHTERNGRRREGQL